jgi:DNA-binding MarR family transcriptional regulator
MNNSEMEKDNDFEELVEMEGHIIVLLFLIQQRWGYIINKKFQKDHITTKQWLMLIILGNVFSSPPSMQEVAKAMSTTHQNVKQLAIRLENRGLLKIARDPQNRRILRLKITEECQEFWKKRKTADIKSINDLFNGLNTEEVKILFEIMIKLEYLSKNLYKWYK